MSDSELTAWHVLARVMVREGISQVCGLPGDDLQAVHAFEREGIAALWTRDQRTAVNVASGRALVSATPSICVFGRGPGAVAAVPAIAEARSGSAPVIVVAEGIAVGQEGAGAFQDLPQREVISPLVKYAVRVTDAARLAGEFIRCLAVATSGGPGPVYLEVPDGLVPRSGDVSPHQPAVIRQIDDPTVRTLLRDAERPVLIVGSGVDVNAGKLFAAFAESVGTAVFTTASGRGAVDERHAMFCGLSGLYSGKAAQRLLAEADLVIAVGTRLEETAALGMSSHANYIQVNREPRDLSPWRSGVCIVGDADEAASAWCLERASRAEWRASIAAAKAADEDTARSWRLRDAPEATGISIPAVMGALSDALPAGAVVVHENGLADMWSYAYPLFRLPEGGLDVAPSEQTTLGAGVGAAVGAALANPERLVVAIVGDGAMSTAAIDGLALADPRLHVLWVVLDNGGFGWLQEAAGARSPGVFAQGAGAPGLLHHPDGPPRAWMARGDSIAEVVSRNIAETRAHGSRILVVPVSLQDTPPMVSRLSEPVLDARDTVTVGRDAS